MLMLHLINQENKENVQKLLQNILEKKGSEIYVDGDVKYEKRKRKFA